MIETTSGDEARTLTGTVCGLYEAVFSLPPFNGDAAEFANQRSYYPDMTRRSGFRLTAARAGEEYVGTSYWPDRVLNGRHFRCSRGRPIRKRSTGAGDGARRHSRRWIHPFLGLCSTSWSWRSCRRSSGELVRAVDAEPTIVNSSITADAAQAEVHVIINYADTGRAAAVGFAVARAACDGGEWKLDATKIAAGPEDDAD